MTTATTIAEALRMRLGERLAYLPDRKIHVLLYLAQGLHLASNDMPLFDEPIVATEQGVHVLGLDQPANHTTDEIGFATCMLVASRYGGLSTMDLEALIRGQGPWSATRLGVAIDIDLIRRTFQEQDEIPEGTVTGYPRSVRAAFHPPYSDLDDQPRKPDTAEDINAFIAEVKAGM